MKRVKAKTSGGSKKEAVRKKLKSGMKKAVGTLGKPGGKVGGALAKKLLPKKNISGKGKK